MRQRRFFSFLPAVTLPASAASSQEVFERLLLVITFLLIFIMAARTPLDTDMWWHLSAGKEMLHTGKILQMDIFSFTRAGAHWTNPYWFSQVSMAAIFNGLGYLGLSAAVAILAVLSMVLVYLQCEGPGWLKSTALLLGSVVASVVWSPRPQLVSLVLMALVGYLLYLYKWRQKNVLWVLPLAFIFWGNNHGGYPLGLMLIGFMIAGEALNHLLALPVEYMLPWRKIFLLAGWGILSGLAVLINPNGLNIWLLPFQTVDMAVLQQFIPEWASPDFHVLLQQSFLWLLLAAFVAVGLSGRNLDGSDLVTLLGFAYMTFLARRNYGPFALAAVPILCRYGKSAVESWQARSAWLAKLKPGKTSGERSAAKKVINLALVALLGFVAFGKLYAVSYPALVDGFLEQSTPVRAAQWLNEHHPGGRILNEYNWGGYLQWALRGSLIYVDGRTDLFNDTIINDWIVAVQAGDGWQEILDRHQVDVVMLEPGRPLIAKLQGLGWRLLYEDRQAVILAR